MDRAKHSKKSTVVCPGCSSQLAPSEAQYMSYFAVYKPFHCLSCETDFRLANAHRWVFFLFGCVGLVMAICLRPIKEELNRNPDLQNIILLAVVIITFLGMLYISVDKKNHLVKKDDVKDRWMHFISHYILLISILASCFSFYLLSA